MRLEGVSAGTRLVTMSGDIVELLELTERGSTVRVRFAEVLSGGDGAVGSEALMTNDDIAHVGRHAFRGPAPDLIDQRRLGRARRDPFRHSRLPRPGIHPPFVHSRLLDPGIQGWGFVDARMSPAGPLSSFSSPRSGIHPFRHSRLLGRESKGGDS